jgi:hypothetical protein
MDAKFTGDMKHTDHGIKRVAYVNEKHQRRCQEIVAAITHSGDKGRDIAAIGILLYGTQEKDGTRTPEGVFCCLGCLTEAAQHFKDCADALLDLRKQLTDVPK